MRGHAGRCWWHLPVPADHAVGSGECHSGKGRGHCPQSQRTWQRWQPLPVPSSPWSRSSLGQRCLFVLLIDTKRPHLGSAEPPLHPWQHGTPKPIFQCGFCGLGMYFRILIWGPRSELRTLPSPSLVPISAPPVLPGTELFSSGHSQPLLGPCRCGEDGGRMQSIPGHVWDGHLQEVPT